MRKSIALGLAIFGSTACRGVFIEGEPSAGGSAGMSNSPASVAGSAGLSFGGSNPGSAAINDCRAPGATPGALDPTFGEAGIARIVEPSASDSRNFVDLALAADGSVYALGIAEGMVLFHLDAQGRLDTSFGNAGFVLGRSGDYGFGLTLDAKGNLLVAGSDQGGRAATIQRFTPEGKLDVSFGDAGRTSAGDDRFVKVLVKADGSLVAMGHSNRGTLLLFMDKDGMPLSILAQGEFGQDGLVWFGAAGSDTIGVDLSEQAGGAVLVLGRVEAEDGAENHPFWFKIDAQGVADSGFNRYPIPGFIDVPTWNASSLAISKNASGAVTGWASNGDQLVAFDDRGTAAAFSSARAFHAESVALDGAGRVLAVGAKLIGDRTSGALARFNANGALDTTFGLAGIANWDAGEYSSFSRVRISSEGCVLAGGRAAKAFVVARYLQ